MGRKKISVKEFEKRRNQSKTFKDWNDEKTHFDNSPSEILDIITPADKLYSAKKKKTILDEDLEEVEDIREYINKRLKRN